MKTKIALPFLFGGRSVTALIALIGGLFIVLSSFGLLVSSSGMLFANEVADGASDTTHGEVAKDPASVTTDPMKDFIPPISDETGGSESEAYELSIFQSDPLQSLAQSLRLKEEEMDEREASLEERERRLETLRLEIAENLNTMEVLRQRMEKITGEAARERKKELKKWVEILEAMKPPARTGAVLDTLDVDFQVELLAQMDPKKAVKIMETLNAEKVAVLAQKLAERGR